MDCLLGATNPFTLNRTLIGHIRLSIIIARDMIQTDNSPRATTRLANPGGVAGQHTRILTQPALDPRARACAANSQDLLGDVGGDVASATASSEELRWVTCPLA